jgi:hypothetical protein
MTHDRWDSSGRGISPSQRIPDSCLPACLLGLRVRIRSRTWLSVFCECCVLYSYKSLRWADPSSRGVQPCVCLCVCVCLSLNVFKCSSNPLNLQWVVRKTLDWERKNNYSVRQKNTDSLLPWRWRQKFSPECSYCLPNYTASLPRSLNCDKFYLWFNKIQKRVLEPNIYILKKQSHYRAEQAHGVPGGWGPQKSAHEGGKVVSPTHRPPLPPRRHSWYSFLLEAESIPGP